MSKGSLWWVRSFRELIYRRLDRIRSGFKTDNFQVNTIVREARKAINENRKISPETNPLPPKIIRTFNNIPDRKMEMFIQRVVGVFTFMSLKI